ncbi:AAA family ATPase [Planotetraspora sp. A-T 1434]|uniref:ATP-binding protein n=1 Tax=Planotetraspora sp. A-T 1434 TaxID=2979219 RepID=UPI0021BE376F|nr:LuxR family transcriptional regulator [Planotetraspora sp. A-T 1434]MCT9929272.1 AAA family ATPase [Planotetraspora sp. A-T 1434]
MGPTPLVGRQNALSALGSVLAASLRDGFQFVTLVGDPGAGKTRLLGELVTMAGERGFTTLWGRAAEFEQVMPFSALVDALDDHLDARRQDIVDSVGAAQAGLLAGVFPALATGEERPVADRSGLVRYRLYRALRQMVDLLAGPSGLVLILDDVHWADDSSMEFLDHIIRHPPARPVLVAAAYRPAQAPPRLATLATTAASRGHEVVVGPLGPAEVEEFLGPAVSRPRSRALYEASAGNPFYLEALARMGDTDVAALPPTVLAALQVELGDLSPDALLVAQAAAVAADEFEPSMAAVAAEVPAPTALAALDELVERDIVRASGGRFRFRHPLVRRAAYESAAAGWRLAAHARIAAHLARLGAPATVRAHHVEHSGSFGDLEAVGVLVTAARAVTTHAPATSAHWLQAALRLMPGDAATREERLALLMELSWAQGVSGRLADGRDTARELLRLLPEDDYPRRARAARLCALMERQLDRPHEARALLLDELSRMPNPRAAAAVPLRMRLVAESMMRVDFRAAQAVLDLMPDTAEDWEPGLEVAVAALRPMPAFAAGRTTEALGYAERADRLINTAPDDHLSEWLDAIAWLCWAETSLGRYGDALRHFDRAAAVARSTGQSYILTNLLAGRARTLVTMGRLDAAMVAAEESVEGARLLDSGQQLVFALTQVCLAASWAGDDDTAIGAGNEAVQRGVGGGEVWEATARYARGQALINAGRLEEGADAVLDACNGFDSPRLDRATLLLSCETLAQVAAARGHTVESMAWAARAAQLDDPALPAFSGLVPLARAHALRAKEPASAAAAAAEAAELLAAADRRLDAGRALLVAGLAHQEAADKTRARERLKAAADVFGTCGAGNLKTQAERALRRLGVRVTAGGDASRLGLSPREMEVAQLVADGLTNQQVAQRLFLSVRTVETHLSRIFAKLEVSSRVGVATALSRRD